MPKTNSDEPEIEINAKLKGSDICKHWGKNKKMNSNSGTGGALYGIGLIGALVYWMKAAIGFGAVVTGILKALVWPAYIVYKLLETFYGVIT